MADIETPKKPWEKYAVIIGGILALVVVAGAWIMTNLNDDLAKMEDQVSISRVERAVYHLQDLIIQCEERDEGVAYVELEVICEKDLPMIRRHTEELLAEHQEILAREGVNLP